MTAHQPFQPWLALLVVPCCAACGGCRPAAVDPKPLVVLASGDTAGWIVPCGCTSNQSGGLPRRAKYLEELRSRAEVVVVDVGGAPGGRSPYDRLKFEAILQGEIAMGIAAHNIGAGEAAMGGDYLKEVARRLGVAFVSANVSTVHGEPLGEPLRIVEVAAQRVAVVGVLSPRYSTPALPVASPREAVLDALRRAAGQYDSAVVLAYLPEEELRQLAESLPEVDVVVGGPTGQPVAPKPRGPTTLAAATRQGKFLVRLDAPASKSGGGWSGEVVELDRRFADEPGQVVNLQQFRDLLAERDFTPGDTSWAQPLPRELPAGFAVVGTDACRKCHAEDCRVWDGSRHAAAWTSLSKNGAHVDPDCQRCHTTGYGLPEGFVSVKRSPRRTAVGCESCHGPSQGHSLDPKTRTAHFAEAKNHCTGCHDRENSPGFELEAYWAKIRHGKAGGKGEGR
jgi:hypothetical protein